MENFKKTLKKRFIAYITLAALLLTVNAVLVILNALEILKPVATSMGTVYGASIGACVVLLKYAIDAKKALKDEKRFKKLYVANTDERMLFIEKSTSNEVLFSGRGSRIRTYECWNQNPVPYRLAIPLSCIFILWGG